MASASGGRLSVTKVTVAVICLGVTIGSELEFGSYFVRRFFDIRSFAELYGYVLASYGLGAAAGPLIMGVSYDLTRGYEVGNGISAICVLAASGCLLSLGPYRYEV